MRILEAELSARGLKGFMSNGVEAPSLIRELRLPASSRHSQALHLGWWQPASLSQDAAMLPTHNLQSVSVEFNRHSSAHEIPHVPHGNAYFYRLFCLFNWMLCGRNRLFITTEPLDL